MSSPFADVELDDQRTTAKLAIDKKIYSTSAVLSACYWFSRDLWFQVDDVEDHLCLTVRIRVSSPTLAQPRVRRVDEWLPDICNAILDAQLRTEIQAETAPIRELIIAKAFAESGVLEDSPPGTFEDPVGPRTNKKTTHLIEIRATPPK